MMSNSSSLLMSVASEHEIDQHAPSTTINDAVRVCDELETLVSNGLNETAELSIWRRQPPHEVRAALNSTDLETLEDFRISGLADDVKRSAETYLNRSGLNAIVNQFIQGDINSLLRLTYQPDTQYTLRLECVDDDACRRFHKDSTDFRLITTYCGRGTQWGETDSSGNVQDIQELQTFDVALFLGKRSERRAGILHRSPPIAGSNEKRFLMVIDVNRPGRQLNVTL